MTSVVDFTRALGELGAWRGSALPPAGRCHCRRRQAWRFLPPGMRLPPERGLAIALAISRTTVVQANARLREAGWLESRHGSGSWIRRSGKIGSPSPQEHEVSTAFRRNVVFRSLIERSSATISFVSAQLSPLPEVDGALRLVADMGTARLGDGAGYFPMGLPALRKAVAGHLGRKGLPTREDQFLLRMAPSKLSAWLRGCWSAGARPWSPKIRRTSVLSTSSASAGARCSRCRAPRTPSTWTACARFWPTRPRLLYLVPTFHNPTGALMCEATRRQIARLCQELQIPVVEDNAACGIALGARPCPPPIAAFAPAAPILTIGSLSKLFWTGLRVGFIRGPESWIARLGRFKALSDLGGPLLSQVVAVTLLEHASVAEQARASSARNRTDAHRSARAQAAQLELEQARRRVVAVGPPSRGDAEELAQIAQRHGVALVAGWANSPDRRFADHVRLPIVGDAATMSEGIARLARAAAEYHPRPRASGFEVVV